MKTKTFFPMCLVVPCLLMSFSSFAQENKEPKKALDAFITTTTKAVTKAAPASTPASISVASEPVSGVENAIKREKGDATKTGDKYMGQVAHF